MNIDLKDLSEEAKKIVDEIKAVKAEADAYNNVAAYLTRKLQVLITKEKAEKDKKEEKKK